MWGIRVIVPKKLQEDVLKGAPSRTPRHRQDEGKR